MPRVFSEVCWSCLQYLSALYWDIYIQFIASQAFFARLMYSFSVLVQFRIQPKTKRDSANLGSSLSIVPYSLVP